MAEQVDGQTLRYMGEGVRQNRVLSTFDSYKLVHYAGSFEKALSPQIARSMHFTMLADWGIFFTKAKMVDALEQALEANTTSSEFRSLSSEISRFKSALLSLPIKNGTKLKFNHSPSSGLEIQMKGPNGYVPVFRSSNQVFSMKIFAIWLGKAHEDANNKESLERLIEDLWKNAS